MMVLLSGALRSSCTGNKLQALEGWVLLLKALAQHAPFHLGGMANQVCLMPHVRRLVGEPSGLAELSHGLCHCKRFA